MGEEVVVVALPKCDLCDQPARYDAKTRYGPWANLCEQHWKTERASPKLGTGIGQRLVVK